MARHPIADGVLRALALAPGIVPLGVVFGAAAVEAGFEPLAALALSALVFAGGAQFAAVGLIGAGGAAAAVVLLVGVINSRYLLLSAATLEIGRRSGATTGGRYGLALGTVDESYALQAAWAREAAAPLVGLFTIPATLWILWTSSTLVGTIVGGALPDLAPFGLDYALPGIFVGLFGIFADSRPRLLAGAAAVVVGGGLALLGYGVVAVLVVPPALAFALGRWGPR